MNSSVMDETPSPRHRHREETTEIFKKCLKWSLQKSEFSLEPNGNLWSTVHNISYSIGDYQMNVDNSSAKVCVPESILPPKNFDLDLLFVVNWFVSIICIIVILVFSCFYPKTKYESRALYCHLGFLIPDYLFLINKQLDDIPVNSFGIIILIGELVFNVCTVCWLNIFGMEIGYQFYHLRCSVNCPRVTWKTFFFQLFVVIFLTVSFTVAFIFVDPSVCNVEQAKTKTAFTQKNDLFLMIVNSCLIYMNCIIFIYIAITVRRVGNEVEVVNKKIHYQLFKVYVTLIVILVGSWSVQMYTIATIRNAKKHTLYYSLPSLFNTLQGLFLLIAYLCKTTVRENIRSLFKEAFQRECTSSSREPCV